MTKLPEWLSGDEDNLRIKLSKPIKINGILTDAINLHAPSIMDEQAARKVAGGDEEKYELTLFANLAGCAPGDFTGNGNSAEAIRSKDYRRLQVAYMRFLADDEAGGSAEPVPSAGG